MFYFISAAKPLEELSATRPHPSIFCVYFFASLLGQFAMHLTFLIFMYRWVCRNAGVGAECVTVQIHCAMQHRDCGPGCRAWEVWPWMWVVGGAWLGLGGAAVPGCRGRLPST
jgi:hypothetical protein